MRQVRLTIIILTAAALLAPMVSAQDDDLSELLRAPYDPNDAYNIRVWLSLERPQRCKTEVTIYDKRGNVVRDFFTSVLPPGIYSFYWDKKNDSGEYVPPGEYVYVAEDCGGQKRGDMLVEYVAFERAVEIDRIKWDDSAIVAFDLDRDSATVTLEIFNRREELVATPVADSLYMAGEHRINPTALADIPPGDLTARLTVGEFVYQREMRINR